MRYLLVLVLSFALAVHSQNIESLKKEFIDDLEAKDVANERIEDPTLLILQPEETTLEPNISNEIFGKNFIRTIPTTVSASSDLPVPGEYKISINDILTVVLSGTREDIIEARVNLDGTIIIPDIGSISVVGETFQDARQKLESIFKQSYVGVSVFISLKEISAKKITITGAVVQPGTYIVNPFTTISTALAYSSGILDYASLRNITLIKPSGKKYVYDLYELLIYGKRTSDQTIESGDTIIVPGTNNFVSIKGEVLRPQVYEYKKEDTIQSLVEFSLGLTKDANSDEIFINEIINSEIVSSVAKLDRSLRDAEILELYVPKSISKTNTGIIVKGNSVKERLIQFGKYKNLGEVIDILEFSDNLYPFYANIFQSSKDGQIKETYSFSLKDPSTYEGIVLKENAQIRFLSFDDINDNQKYLLDQIKAKDVEEISFTESVEESVEKDDNLSNLESLFNTPKSNFKVLSFGSKSMVIPLIGNFSVKELFDFYGENKIFNDGLIIGNDSVVSTEDINIINSDDILQINFFDALVETFEVDILGEVQNPGTYIVSSRTSLNDLYSISGGFTNKASHDSIVFTRKSIKDREIEALNQSKDLIFDAMISQLTSSATNSGNAVDFTGVLEVIKLSEEINFLGRFTGDISPDSETSKNTFLQNGDKVIVKPKSKTISILGEVNNPITTTLDESLRFKDYILLAGGDTKNADMKNIYVINADGTSKPLRGRLNEIPLAGDTIVVPRDLDQIQAIPLITLTTKIISDIAFAAASLNILNNN